MSCLDMDLLLPVFPDNASDVTVECANLLALSRSQDSPRLQRLPWSLRLTLRVHALELFLVFSEHLQQLWIFYLI